MWWAFLWNIKLMDQRSNHSTRASSKYPQFCRGSTLQQNWGHHIWGQQHQNTICCIRNTIKLLQIKSSTKSNSFNLNSANSWSNNRKFMIMKLCRSYKEYSKRRSLQLDLWRKRKIQELRSIFRRWKICKEKKTMFLRSWIKLELILSLITLIKRHKHRLKSTVWRKQLRRKQMTAWQMSSSSRKQRTSHPQNLKIATMSWTCQNHK